MGLGMLKGITYMLAECFIWNNRCLTLQHGDSIKSFCSITYCHRHLLEVLFYFINGSLKGYKKWFNNNNKQLSTETDITFETMFSNWLGNVGILQSLGITLYISNQYNKVTIEWEQVWVFLLVVINYGMVGLVPD